MVLFEDRITEDRSGEISEVNDFYIKEINNAVDFLSKIYSYDSETVEEIKTALAERNIDLLIEKLNEVGDFSKGLVFKLTLLNYYDKDSRASLDLKNLQMN